MRLPRLSLVASLAALCLALAAAPPTATGATVSDHMFEHQGRGRTYRVVVPKGHDKTKPVPLVLAIHGGGGTAELFDRSAGGQFAREADARGWVVVFPQGIEKGWNDGRKVQTPQGRRRAKIDDVGFLSAVIDRVHASHGIDRTRVYATGISNGGFMSIRLGLDLADKIAAVAPVTAQLQAVHREKTPAHPVGLMVINGTKDPLVPYDGGHVTVMGRKRGAILSTDATIARWRALNGCTQDAKPVAIADKDPKDGTKSTITRYAACAKGAEVVLVRVEGGGHAWPGGRQYFGERLIGKVSRDFQAVPLIFDFFARHKRASAAPATTPSTK